MSKQGYFITGTDTEVGKTYVCAGLLAAAARKGLRSFGIKPVAAGAEVVDGQLRNEDALQIQQAGSIALRYEQVNPVLFEPPIAPHIAAAKEERLVTVSRLEGFVRGTMLLPHDFCLVEGAGGWRVPLNDREFLSGLAKQLQLPVIVVVSMRLGCINHALMTVESVVRDGLPVAGWVANAGQDMSCYEENLQTLKSMISAPYLGALTWQASKEQSFKEFDGVFAALSG